MFWKAVSRWKRAVGFCSGVSSRQGQGSQLNRPPRWGKGSGVQGRNGRTA